jgi:hypothetical protein
MALLFFLSGVLLGIYGFVTYYNGKKIGIAYTYFSIISMVILPIIVINIIEIYNEYIKDEIIYRRASRGWVTCHLPALPVFVEEDRFIESSVLTSIYAIMMGYLALARRERLKSKLKKQGVIPQEYYDILKKEGF